jgi:acetoin utilization protein AcuB
MSGPRWLSSKTLNLLNKDIISGTIPSLRLSDSVVSAQELMGDLHVAHLPVVSDGKFAGLVSEDILLNAPDSGTPLFQLKQEFSNIAVRGSTHFLEAVQFVNEFNLTVIPVIEEQLEYLGSVTATDLLKHLGKITGADLPGAIIVLEMDRLNFSFSEISKLVETNDALITQLNTYGDGQSSTFYVTLKINKLEISDIISTFQRYEYKVKYYFGEELYENELRSNYEHLMNYLKI